MLATVIENLSAADDATLRLIFQAAEIGLEGVEDAPEGDKAWDVVQAILGH